MNHVAEQTDITAPILIRICDFLSDRDASSLSRTNRHTYKQLRDHLIGQNVTNSGTSCLPFAAAEGNLEVLEVLQQCKGFRVDARLKTGDKKGDNALLRAIDAKHEKFALALVRIEGDHVNLWNNDRSPLSAAIEGGQTEVVRALLQVPNIDVNGPKGPGYGRPLLSACRRRNETILQLLLTSRRIDAGVTDSSGRTALHIAAELGLPRIAEILVMNGRVSIEARNRRGRSALSVAIHHRHFDVVEAMQPQYMLPIPTTPDLKSADGLGGRTNLDYALQERYQLQRTATRPWCMNAAYLIDPFEQELSVAERPQRRAALLSAAVQGNTGVFMRLLEDVEPNFHDSKRRTPAYYARAWHHAKIVSLIKDWNERHCGRPCERRKMGTVRGVKRRREATLF